MSRRAGAQLVVIYWRDIPAQVNAQVGRDRHQVVLPGKFQRAIDRAKRKAGIVTAADDVAQWRRVSRPIDGSPSAAAADEAARIDAGYDRDRLGRLAYAGGFEADVAGAPAASASELAALEELDEPDRDPTTRDGLDGSLSDRFDQEEAT